MGQIRKIKRNDNCPCMSGIKFKHCCEGKVDWKTILNEDQDSIPYLSVRGRNLFFIEKIAEALQLDSLNERSLANFKKAFTARAVREIHEAIEQLWPPNMDIRSTLSKLNLDVSGLYVGDYRPEYLWKGILRHSIYSNKIIIVDPFVYPRSVRDEFNPIINPEEYRAQTLKNVNLWFSLIPWIVNDIIGIIRTPADFDRRLNWESIERQREKFKENRELAEALEASKKTLIERRKFDEELEFTVLSVPNTQLRRLAQEYGSEGGAMPDDYIAYIEKLRSENPDFLEPLSESPERGQLYKFSSGANYEIAKLTSEMTGSYLITDIYSRWKEIEIDRRENNVGNTAWEPFAKAFAGMKLTYLDNIGLQHAMNLRNEGRLESLRVFLRRVWKDASNPSAEFSDENIRLLTDELNEQVKHAEEEWKQIDRDLSKWLGVEVTGLAGNIINMCSTEWLPAAIPFIGAGVYSLVNAHHKRQSFPNKFPAAFFMNLK